MIFGQIEMERCEWLPLNFKLARKSVLENN